MKHQTGNFRISKPNLPRALEKGTASSGIFVLARFLTICFFFHMLDRILTKLGQNDQWVGGYKSYQQFDLKGHVGVTGVKNVLKICFYGKCYSSYMLHSRVTWLKYIKKLETRYKTYRLKFRFGVIWGHRGQICNFHQKCFSSYIIHCMLTSLMHINKLETLYSSYCLKFWYGVFWGLWGQ